MNERINEKNISNIVQLSSFAVTEGQFGRVIFDKTKRLSATTSTKATTISASQHDMSDTSLCIPEAFEIKEIPEISDLKSPTDSRVTLTDCPSSPESDPGVFCECSW